LLLSSSNIDGEATGEGTVLLALALSLSYFPWCVSNDLKIDYQLFKAPTAEDEYHSSTRSRYRKRVI